MKFSIVIPTYGRLDLVTACVKSIKKYEPNTKEYEIIVVDDFSTVENRENIKKLATTLGFKLVGTDRNVGFASAVNAGARHSHGTHIILCNNDVLFTNPILEKFKQSHLCSKAPIIGCTLFYPNGAIQHGGGAYQNGVFFHTNDPKSTATSRYCIYVTFALVSIERYFYNCIGNLDENFFMACDDSEYCIRAWSNDLKVFYDASITAIHAEGATRGRTHAEKKNNRKCLEEEKKSIARLTTKMGNIVSLLRKVQSANMGNTPDIKIEIGSGYNPQPGYQHIDARPDLPSLHHCLDFSKDALPYGDGEVCEILSNHSIEHISYRKLPFVFQEWARVLKPGGKLLLRTPDLRFICETYLAGKTTPEWPDDEKYIRDNFGNVSPAWWANIKLFAGQDYPGNFHQLCFDFEMLKSALIRYGFDKITKLDIKPVYSPGELQIEAFKAVPRPTIRIKRMGALGDVILTTPLIIHLSAMNDIHVTTGCPEVFKNHPAVKTINTNFPCDQFIDLDLAYENDPKKHIVDAYAKAAQCPEFRYMPPWIWGDEHPLPDLKNYVVVHAARTWENRTWPAEYWDQVSYHLGSMGYAVIAVGSNSDMKVRDATNIRGMTIHQLKTIINGAKAFIGSDSGILHIAATTETPIVGIFTCAKGEYRLPKRSNAVAVRTNLECYGCLHDVTPPVTYVGCKIGGNPCVREITPDAVISVFNALLTSNGAEGKSLINEHTDGCEP
jgi:GT2 family glycosyltransferase/ADP-heptose:LPS heptosyltransferase